MPGSEINRKSLIVALACGIGMSVGPTPMVSAVATLFMKPLREEFGLSSTAVSTMLLLSPLTVALFAPLGGRLLDRFGVRPVLLPAVLLFAAANAAMWFVNSVLAYILLASVISVCITVHCYSSYTKVLALWFSRRRGLVTGITIACSSNLSAAIIPHIVQPWIETGGWRWAYLGMGGIVLIWGLPALLLLLREPKPTERAEPVSTERPAELTGMERSEAIRTRVFWMIALAMYLAPLTIIGTLAHSFTMLTERGVASVSAQYALSFIYMGGMVGQLSSGYLLDRVPSPRVVLVYFCSALLGVLVFHHATAPNMLAPGALLLGLGQGAEMSILAYLTSRYFGLRNYGAIYGRLFGFANAGIATGLLTMGLVRDAAGSYAPMGYVLPCTLALSILMFGLLPHYSYARAGENTAPPLKLSA